LEVRTSKYSLNGNTTTRTSITPSKLFLFAAMMNREEFEVLGIEEIRQGLHDKKRNKELDKKKMEF
jgi:hypothetical protein